MVVASFICGPSAININFFENQDMVWGVALLVSGLFVALAMVKYGVEKARTEIINPVSDIKIGKWWNACIRLFPVMFAAIWGWWVYQSYTWYPDTWWNPLEIYSPGTMVLQWGLAALVLIIFNDRIAKAIKGHHTGIEGGRE